MSLFPAPEIENNWRFELKYQLTYDQYLRVKSAFNPYVQLDPYTKARPEGKYLVRSLYFDSLDYQSYDEKLGGNYSRYKLRIRTYSNTVDNNTVVRVEAKIRQGSKTEKHGVFVPVSAYCHFMKHYHWDCGFDPVLNEFERLVHARVLRPKVLVEYHREGFQSRDRQQIRVTFDHQVRSAEARTLFPTRAFFRQHHPHQVVLEIKHKDQQPDWLKTIVQDHSLKIESNSKYCQGIEITQLDLVNHSLRV